MDSWSIVVGLLLLVYWPFYRVPKADDFYKTNLRYTATYTWTRYDGKAGQVVLHSSNGDYTINRQLLKPLTTEQVAVLLRKSTEATVWLEEPEDKLVRAIKTDDFEIPVNKAVEWFEQGRRTLLYLALFLIVLGGFADSKLSQSGEKK